MKNFESIQNKKGSYSDDWDKHKNDIHVWRKFWALWELRRKWKWADWFYRKLDRDDDEIVAPKYWTLFPGENYMKLCLWIAILKSVHEGVTENLDPYDTPEDQRFKVSKIFTNVPIEIKNFPDIKLSKFKDFRNAIFHCQWSPTLSKFISNL